MSNKQKSTKEKLVVLLKAGEKVIAEVEDPALWRQILGVIYSTSESPEFPVALPNNANQVSVSPKLSPQSTNQNPANSVTAFAKKLGITEAELVGAINPTKTKPFLQLDRHCWEAMKKSTPERGAYAVNPTTLAGTLLALWFKEAGLGNATQANAADVLLTIDITDRNASRAVKNAKWLQARPGGVITLNPAKISQAEGIAKSFCTQKWGSNDE